MTVARDDRAPQAHHAPGGGLTRRVALGGLMATTIAGGLGPPSVAIAANSDGTARGPTRAIPAPGLGRGINLSWWLNLTGQLQPSDDELAGLREAGFGHVRLPVDPMLLGWTPEDADTLPPGIERLDEAVRRIVAAGLDLIVDLHPGEELVVRLAGGDPAVLAGLWGSLAERYAGITPDRLLFEVVNEPHRFLGTSAELARLHARSLAAIRRSCPRHRVVVNGLFDPRLSLRTIEPMPDPGVIYAFQFYEPYAVTHQGADWDPEELGGVSVLRNLPYPAARLDSPWTIAARAWFRPRAVRLLVDYQRQGWDAERVDDRIAEAAAWSARHARPVLCTEFGVMRSYIDADSRTAWLRDARRAFDRHGIAWTVWEYDGLFGIATGCEEGSDAADCRSLEPASLQALGFDEDEAGPS